MHGVIFTSFRDYLVSAHGNDTATAVFGAEPEYLLSESYPDDGLLRLVEPLLAGRSQFSLVLGKTLSELTLAGRLCVLAELGLVVLAGFLAKATVAVAGTKKAIMTIATSCFMPIDSNSSEG